jgi:putative transposase
MDGVAEMLGYPCIVVSDNRTAPTSNEILKWQEDRNVDWHYIALGKAMQNGFVESINGRMRDECLYRHVLNSLRHAPHLVAAWRTGSIHRRRHSSLAGVTPAEYVDRSEKNQILDRASLR